MRVDEPRRHVAVASIDDAPAAKGPRRRHGGDATTTDTEVSSVPGVPAPVHDPAVGDNDVEDGHAGSPPHSENVWYWFSHGGPAHAYNTRSSRSQTMLPTVIPCAAAATLSSAWPQIAYSAEGS